LIQKQRPQPVYCSLISSAYSSPLQWHIPELDCPPGGDRGSVPIDERDAKPLWAERMGLSGSKQGAQSSTVYGHRREYLPSQKVDARSMVSGAFHFMELHTSNHMHCLLGLGSKFFDAFTFPSITPLQYERYQPSYQRIINEELPDTADPPDGRFWKAGVAQGVTTNPYEKRLAISGRRKPIVVGPHSISVVVDGEGHTLANAVRDVAWLQ